MRRFIACSLHNNLIVRNSTWTLNPPVGCPVPIPTVHRNQSQHAQSATSTHVQSNNNQQSHAQPTNTAPVQPTTVSPPVTERVFYRTVISLILIGCGVAYTFDTTVAELNKTVTRQFVSVNQRIDKLYDAHVKQNNINTQQYVKLLQEIQEIRK